MAASPVKDVAATETTTTTDNIEQICRVYARVYIYIYICVCVCVCVCDGVAYMCVGVPMCVCVPVRACV